METALHTIMTSVPEAAAIWIAMLVMVALFALMLVRPQAPGASSPESIDARCADEIAIAADRAATTAERCRSAWLAAQDAVARAWADYELADAAVRRVAAASAFPTFTRGWAGSFADRERNLHRAATAACRRDEIGIGELNDALAHRGWDPGRHPIAQETALATAARDRRMAEYRRATVLERDAWAASEAAAEALASLRAEALDARFRVGERVRTAGERWWVEQWSATQPLPVVSSVDAAQPAAA